MRSVGLVDHQIRYCRGGLLGLYDRFGSISGLERAGCGGVYKTAPNDDTESVRKRGHAALSRVRRARVPPRLGESIRRIARPIMYGYPMAAQWSQRNKPMLWQAPPAKLQAAMCVMVHNFPHGQRDAVWVPYLHRSFCFRLTAARSVVVLSAVGPGDPV